MLGSRRESHRLTAAMCKQKPLVIGRKPFGRIAIANSDAGASATTK